MVSYFTVINFYICDYMSKIKLFKAFLEEFSKESWLCGSHKTYDYIS